MRRPLAFLTCCLLGVSAALADDLTRDLQTQLKSEGFYFGEVDGQSGAATTAALKRYQIRNGLEVTGDANPQTLQSLGIGGGSPAPSAPMAPEPAAPEPAPAPESTQVAPPPANPRGAFQPPVNLRREESPVESDRRALRQEEGRPGPAQPPGGGPPNQPSERYRGVFAGTPYASAPRVVQEETFLRAQRVFAGKGLLPEADGAPGPATEEAILVYQRSNRLPASGRLDLETLNALHLLPGRGAGNPGMVSGGPGGPPAQNGPNGPGPNRVARPMPYKGIWVQ